MNTGERAVLRRAVADLLASDAYPRTTEKYEAREDALTRLASMLDIPERKGRYNFKQYETPKAKSL